MDIYFFHCPPPRENFLREALGVTSEIVEIKGSQPGRRELWGDVKIFMRERDRIQSHE